MSKDSKTSKLTLGALILMIFTSVFGFNNIPRAFYLMGYASIFWYILAAITFFIPYAFMLGEMGAAFGESKGGIYSWMERAVNPKFAFVGTFMWFASYIIWMVNVGSSIWVPFSNAIFGVDKTQGWSIFGMTTGVQTLGILGILWIILVTFVTSKGLDKIKKVTSIGGTAIMCINVLLFVGGLVILILNKGEMAQPVSFEAFFKSPNENFTSMIQVFSFIVFAIFAFGGLEVVGSLVDETENAKVNFPKGLAISAIVISVGYAIGIFMIGTFTNWDFVFSSENNGFALATGSTAEVTLGNVSYIAMNNMGYQLGHALNLSEPHSMQVGVWLSRFMGLSMFLSLTGAFFTLIFSPLKTIIEGTPKGLWPKTFSKKNENGMCVNAMIVQAIIVCVMMAFIAFGGQSATKFFEILTNMTNVSMTIPYMFVAYAFFGFKRDETIQKPFTIYKGPNFYKLCVALVIFTVGFANVFTIIEPAINGDLAKTLWSIAGPVFFTIIALVMFTRYEKKSGSTK
ncbi:glutamate/gamma-aminobutyrate family transporter YjeM [Vagococcus vulneris]|uniref:Glutamate/gamma-aminobutyrate family transporter YjeM n=1 Tax=Vagococcus vulneris TaxID=1977869 RepID=A0A430A229_9ENTE|nr:glutamate/gamma-aminobutyrate family transporter YjeM [Vagococcus vulneris]RSU00472.1 glutamate/gamma-aminobutyrate family transporter YjeM [Vagococcus vulneris]